MLESSSFVLIQSLVQHNVTLEISPTQVIYTMTTRDETYFVWSKLGNPPLSSETFGKCSKRSCGLRRIIEESSEILTAPQLWPITHIVCMLTPQTIEQSQVVWAKNELQGTYTFFFYKNLFYQNVEAEIYQNFKNMLRTYPRLRAGEKTSLDKLNAQKEYLNINNVVSYCRYIHDVEHRN